MPNITVAIKVNDKMPKEEDITENYIDDADIIIKGGGYFNKIS